IGRLARLEGNELDGETLVARPLNRGDCSLWELRLALSERVLELVIGKLLELAEVALGDEIEIGLALLVVREALVDDLPADWMPVVQGGERVPELGPIRPVPAESSELLAPVRVNEAKPVAGGPRHQPAFLVDTADQPVASFQPDDGAGAELLVAGVLVHPLDAGTVDGEDLVRSRGGELTK